MKKHITEATLLSLCLFSLLTACGSTEEPDSSIPQMTVQPFVEYGELPQTQETVTYTNGTLPEVEERDMTGTELATTYTDEFGNVYGIVTEATTASRETTSSKDQFPDIGLDEYYLGTEPANTVSVNFDELLGFETTTETTSSYPQPFDINTEHFETAVTTQTTPETYSVTTQTTTSAVTETTTTAAQTLSPEQETDDKNEERVSRRNAVTKSKYTSHNVENHLYVYDQMSSNEQYCYDVIVDAMLGYEKEITFPLSKKITYDDILNAYQHVYTEEVSLYYIDTTFDYALDGATKYVKSIRLNYIYTESQHTKMQSELDRKTEEILSAITPDMSDYDIALYLHDYIIKNCTYTISGNADNIITAYGAIVEGKAQCQGYTRAFSYLCQKCGIPTDYVLGIASEEHMWNMAKLDGNWYHIDLTWDDPDKAMFPDSIRYDYFCLTTDRMRDLRTIEGNNHKLPSAVSTDYEYYIKNKLVASTYEEARQIILSQAYELSKTKSSTLQFRCADEEAFENIYEKLFADETNNTLYILEEANKNSANKFKTNDITSNCNANTFTIKLYLEYV